MELEIDLDLEFGVCLFLLWDIQVYYVPMHTNAAVQSLEEHKNDEVGIGFIPSASNSQKMNLDTHDCCLYSQFPIIISLQPYFANTRPRLHSPKPPSTPTHSSTPWSNRLD